MREAEAIDSQPTADQLQCLTFALSSEVYAVDVLEVKEIRSWSEPTPMPETPDSVLGVMNLRGAIIPVIDLRHLLGIEPATPTALTSVIVVQLQTDDGSRSLGMVVDQVLDVCHLPLKQGDPAAEGAPSVISGYIRSLSLADERLIVILDLATIVGTSLGAENGLPDDAAQALVHAEEDSSAA